MKKSLQKTIFQGLLLILLILFAFWFALKDDFNTVIEQITHVSIIGLSAMLFLGIAYYLLQGYMLYRIAHAYNEQINLLNGIENAYIAAFFNGITPLGGGQIAQTYAFRKLHIAYHDIASILWKDFFLYQCIVVAGAALLFVLYLPFSLHTIPAYVGLIALGLGINTSVLLVLWTMSRFPKLYGLISNSFVHLLHKLHIVKNQQVILEKWNHQVTYFTNEIHKLKQDKDLIIKGILIYALRQVIYYAIPIIAALGIGLSLKAEDIILIIALSSFIHMLNALTPLPGDTGWTETAFILIFSCVFPRSYASSIMILWRISTYYIHIIIGGIIFYCIKQRKETTINEDKKTSAV